MVSTEVKVMLQRAALEDSHLQCIDQKKLSDDDSGPLEIDGLPSIIAKVVHLQHSWVHQLRNLGEDPFEVGEERRIVKCPF